MASGREPRFGLVDIQDAPAREAGIDPGGGKLRVEVELAKESERISRMPSSARAGVQAAAKRASQGKIAGRGRT